MLTHIVTSSVLIVVVILIRSLFKRTASPVFIYALWFAVLLKLCVPYQLLEVDMPEIPVFLFNSSIESHDVDRVNISSMSSDVSQTAIKAVEIVYQTDKNESFEKADDPNNSDADTETVPTTSSEQMFNDNGNDRDDTYPQLPETGNKGNIIIDPDEDKIQEAENDKIYGDTEKVPSHSAPEIESSSIKDFAFFIYISVVLLIVTVMITSYCIFSVRVYKDRRYIGKYKNLKMYVSDSIKSPCLSLIMPRIYLTKSAEASENVSLIAEHEYIHYRHGDHIWSAVRAVLLAIYWFDPLVLISVFLSRHDSEAACDYRLTKKMIDKDRLAYARVIVDMLSNRKGLYVNLNGGSVKKRIEKLITVNKYRIFSAIAAVLLTFTAVGCSFTEFNKSSHENITEEQITTNELLPKSSEKSGIVTAEDNPTTVVDISFDKMKVLTKSDTVSLTLSHIGGSDHRVYDFGVRKLILTCETGNLFRLYITENGKELANIIINGINDLPAFSIEEDGIYLLYNISGDPHKALEIKYDRGIVEYKLTEYKYEKERVLEEANERYPVHSDEYPYYSYTRTSKNGFIKAALSVDDDKGHGGIDLIDENGNITRIVSNILLDDKLSSGKTAELNDVRGYRLYGFIGNSKVIYTVLGYEWTIGYGIYDMNTQRHSEIYEGKEIVGSYGSGVYTYKMSDKNLSYQYNYGCIFDGGVEYIRFPFGNDRSIVKDLNGLVEMSFKNGYWIFICSEEHGARKEYYINIYNDALDELLVSVCSPYRVNGENVFVSDNKAYIYTSVNELENMYSWETKEAENNNPKSENTLYAYPSDAVKIISNIGNFVISDFVNPFGNQEYYDIFGGKYGFQIYSDHNNGKYTDQRIYMIDYHTREIVASCALPGDVRFYAEFKNGKLYCYTKGKPVNGVSPHEKHLEIRYEKGSLTYVPATIDDYPFISKTIVSPDGKYRVNKVVSDNLGNGRIEIVFADGSKKILNRDSILNPNDPTDIGSVNGYKLFGFIDNERFVYTSAGWEVYGRMYIFDMVTGKNVSYDNKDVYKLYPIYIKDGYVYGHTYDYGTYSDDFWIAEEFYKVSADGKAVKLFDNDFEYSLVAVYEDKWVINGFDKEAMVNHSLSDSLVNIRIFSLDFSEKLFEGEMPFTVSPYIRHIPKPFVIKDNYLCMNGL